MVKGLDTFRKYFADYESQYVLIGGVACDILFESNEVNFRATRDLDMVLIVEALTPEFGERLWKFIVDGKYRNKATNGENPQFYRFDKPEDDTFPKMIELFCRSDFELKNAKGITPIHIDDEAKAYLDLKMRSDSGEKVDSSDIKNHKKDVLRIAAELILEKVEDLPITVNDDIHSFIESLEQEPFDQNSLKRYGLKNEDVVNLLKQVFE